MKLLYVLTIISAMAYSAQRGFCAIGLPPQISLTDGIIVFDASYIPQQYEVNLSTCLIIVIAGETVVGFQNFSEFKNCQTRTGLKRKIMQIRSIIDSMSDLPASEIAEYKTRMGWLKSYYLSLP